MVRNHCRTYPAPCVSPLCVCSILHAHAQLCRFDKADVTADVQWHSNHRPSLWYHYFPAQSSLGADILVYWIGKLVQTCASGGILSIFSPVFIAFWTADNRKGFENYIFFFKPYRDQYFYYITHIKSFYKNLYSVRNWHANGENWKIDR